MGINISQYIVYMVPYIANEDADSNNVTKQKEDMGLSQI